MVRESIKEMKEMLKQMIKGVIKLYVKGGLDCPEFYDPKTGECTLTGVECNLNGLINPYVGICDNIWEFRRAKKEYEYF